MKSELIILSNDVKHWRLNGQLHRENGPAVEWSDGVKEWYLNGQRHREDGPAVERPDGTKFWYLNEKLHRENGPAVERADGRKAWYLNGIRLSNRQLLSKKIQNNYSDLYNSYLVYQIMSS